MAPTKVSASAIPLTENNLAIAFRSGASGLIGSEISCAIPVTALPTRNVTHHASRIQSPPEVGPIAIRSWISRTIWYGLTRLAKGTNHQPIDHRGVTDGVPPRSTGVLPT